MGLPFVSPVNDVLVYFEFKHLVMFDYYDDSNYTCHSTKKGSHLISISIFHTLSNDIKMPITSHGAKQSQQIRSPDNHLFESPRKFC